MPHKPEPWRTNASRPFSVIEKPCGDVRISNVGNKRFRVHTTGHDSEVEGYAEARAVAHRLASELE